jgi:hypothetical protein
MRLLLIFFREPVGVARDHFAVASGRVVPAAE